ncbi:hypothetical protein HBH88_000090 [Parastagonospora nodorum]|nr:hypothetical protein HBH88_000090 [Parastagonospora nodorum]
MYTSLTKARSSRERQELEARHSLLNLSVHDLVEKFARYILSKSVYAVFKYLASSSNLSTTTRCVNSSGLLQSNGITIVFSNLYLLSSTLNRADNNRSSDIDKYSKKYLKVCKADALKQVDANRLELEAQLRKASEEEELAKTKKKKREKELDSLLDSNNYCLDSSSDINSKNDLKDEEATTAKDLAREQKERLKALLNAKTRDSLSARLIDAYILYFKELLSNNSRIFANAIGIGKTRAIVLAVLIGHYDLSDPLALQFCFFSNSPLKNIGRLTKEKAIEIRINTTNAISKALAAANKLIIPEANTPAVHSKATKHLCSFRKIDKHMFRAYNTISVIAQRMIIRKGGPYIEKRAILLPSYITFNATNKRDSVTSNRIYKIEDARNIIANIKHNASEHESSYKDILEKEGLNKLEASRRIIFNCFKIQAIASYSALATLKAAQFKTYSSCKVKRFTLNSVKDLFTNLSKNYFLVREAHAITKSSLNIVAEDAAKAANTLLLLKEVCAKILIESYKLIVQAIIVALIAFAEAIILIEATHVVIIELQDSIVYFNSDSELELKVLGK